MATKKDKLGGLGGLASASPWGAFANAASQVVATPNTSASGDVTTGRRSFEGISFGFSPERMPWYAWVAIVGVALVLVWRRR